MFICMTSTNAAYCNVFKKCANVSTLFRVLFRICVTMNLQPVVRTNGSSAHSVLLLGGDFSVPFSLVFRLTCVRKERGRWAGANGLAKL